MGPGFPRQLCCLSRAILHFFHFQHPRILARALSNILHMQHVLLLVHPATPGTRRAFGAAGAMQASWFMHTGEQLLFSEQQV